jgi:hypothetical protein
MQLAIEPVIQAMVHEGVRRLVLTSAYGVGDTWEQVPAVPRIVMRLLFQDLYRDKAIAESELRKSELDWLVVYPVTLTNGPFTGRYRVGARGRLRGFPRVSRADVAHLLLEEALRPSRSRQALSWPLNSISLGGPRNGTAGTKTAT